MQKIKLEKAMTFSFGNDERLESRTMAILPVGIAGVNGELRVHVKKIGCHSDLGRGHLSCEKLRVRAVVTSHLLFPLTSFRPQGHKIPHEIQPRIRSDECAIYRATCDSSRQEKYIRGSPSAYDRRSPETDSTDTESQYGTDGHEQNLCDETRDNWENRKGQ